MTREGGSGMNFLDIWPDCINLGCVNKVCTWGSDTQCYPCEEAEVGTEEMHRRYSATHIRPWTSSFDPLYPNYMTATYAEIRDKDSTSGPSPKTQEPTPAQRGQDDNDITPNP